MQHKACSIYNMRLAPLPEEVLLVRRDLQVICGGMGGEARRACGRPHRPRPRLRWAVDTTDCSTRACAYTCVPTRQAGTCECGTKCHLLHARTHRVVLDWVQRPWRSSSGRRACPICTAHSKCLPELASRVSVQPGAARTNHTHTNARTPLHAAAQAMSVRKTHRTSMTGACCTEAAHRLAVRAGQGYSDHSTGGLGQSSEYFKEKITRSTLLGAVLAVE
jgi:hypothetical protein